MTAPMLVFATIAVGFTLGLIYWEKRNFKIRLKPLLTGALIWFVFTQILEKALHFIVFTKTSLISYPLLFSVYGALAAGVFEETGRYFAFKKMLPKFREWKDALAFGTGHGGFEAIFLGIMLPLQVIILSKMDMEKLTQAQNASSVVINSLLNNTQNYNFWVTGGLERIMAVVLHIALTMIVFYSIKTRKIRYLFLAIFYHALVDFPAAMYQAGKINLMTVELIIFVLTIGNVYFIHKSEAMLNHK